MRLLSELYITIRRKMSDKYGTNTLNVLTDNDQCN